MKFKSLLLAVVLAAPALLAQAGPGPRGPRGPLNLDAVKQVLELTDHFTNELRPAMGQIREKRQALQEEMQRDSPNATIVGQLQVEIAELRKQIRAKHAAQADQLRAVLTDAQKAKLAELQKAAELLPAIHQARALSLLDAPEDIGEGPGFGRGMGFGPMRAFGRRGLRGPAAQPQDKPGQD
jgi:Spy/CpxP family protein refolding chaperone